MSKVERFKCRKCDGTGKMPSFTCIGCGGSGWIVRETWTDEERKWRRVSAMWKRPRSIEKAPDDVSPAPLIYVPPAERPAVFFENWAEQECHEVASSNGRTPDFDSGNGGSNPSATATVRPPYGTTTKDGITFRYDEDEPDDVRNARLEALRKVQEEAWFLRGHSRERVIEMLGNWPINLGYPPYHWECGYPSIYRLAPRGW